MVESVLNTKLKIFEENTRGRILNRFSEDVTVLDNIVYTYLDLTDVRRLLFISKNPIVLSEVRFDCCDSSLYLPMGVNHSSFLSLLP